MLPRSAHRFIGLALLVTVGCSSPPPEPGQVEFESASDKIRSDSAGKARQGSTNAAVVYAGAFADRMARADAELFTGQDEDQTMSFADEFMVYAHHSEHGVAFLVHVPQFKRYKDDTREVLLQVAWQAAHDATLGLHRDQPIKLGVGLRGSLSYGAIAVGASDGPPTIELGESLKPTQLYPFFIGKAIEPASKQAPVVEPPPPVEEPSAPTLSWEVVYSATIPASHLTSQLSNYQADFDRCVAEGVDSLEVGQRFDVRITFEKNGRVKKLAKYAGQEAPDVIQDCLAKAAKDWKISSESLRKAGATANVMFRWGELPPPE